MRRWIPVTVCIAALATGAAGFWLWRERTAPPLGLLAKAYTSQRLTEYRISGARYSPVVSRRGPGGETSVELLESKARIRPALFTASSQGAWFHAKGRAELIELNYDQAIRSFQAAVDMGQDSAGLWVDFGAAYAGRADRPNASIDYTRAIELFSEALRRDAHNAAALYNRALAEARLSLLSAAERDLNQAVKFDAESGWVAESQAQLRRVSDTRRRPPVPPAVSHARSEEAELEDLLQNWNPEASPEAVVDLSVRLVQRNHDAWLSSLATAGRNHSQARAIRTLTLLERRRRRFQLADPPELAADTSWLRSAALPPALAVWRDFEYLDRASNGLDVDRCNPLRPVLNVARERAFRWFAVQASLAYSTCLSARGELTASNDLIEQARRLADEGGYRIAAIRAAGFSATRLGDEGRNRESIETTTESLNRIALEQLPLARSHQFYASLWQTAERLQRWNTARAAIDAAAQIAHDTEQPRLEMFGRIRLAEDLWRLGDQQGFRAELEAADRIGRSLQSDATIRSYLSFARFRLSSLQGQPDAPEVDEQLLLNTPNLFLDAPYLVLRATRELRSSRPAEALRLAELALSRIAARPGDIRRFHREDSEASAVLVAARVSMSDYPGALTAWRSAIRRARQLPVVPAEPGHVLPGHTRVSIIPLDGHLGIFTESSTGVNFHRASFGNDQGLALLRRLKAMASDPRTDLAALMEIAHTLRAGLFGIPGGTPGGPAGPDSKRWSAPRLTVEAEGEWANLPLLLLFDDASVASFAVPAPSVRSACPPYRDSLALVQAATSEFARNFGLPPLPGLSEERAAIARALPEGGSFDDSGPIGAAFERAAGFRWLHFSGHAVRWRESTVLLGRGDPQAPGEEERLGLWRLTSARHFCSRLVFFAACSTAAFEESESVDSGQLAGDAVLHGARQVIAALWDVDSAAAAELAARFYQALPSNPEDPAAVLRSSALALRASPRFRHPYYWAPFVTYQSDEN